MIETDGNEHQTRACRCRNRETACRTRAFQIRVGAQDWRAAAARKPYLGEGDHGNKPTRQGERGLGLQFFSFSAQSRNRFPLIGRLSLYKEVLII